MYFPQASFPETISNKDIFPLDVQIPYWHVCLSANPVAGRLTVNLTADMIISALSSTLIPPLIGLIKPSWCMRPAGHQF